MMGALFTVSRETASKPPSPRYSGEREGSIWNAMKTLQQRCAAIELLVVDVDGVLTDGGIAYTANGVEVKRFHVRDGSGLKCWEQAGKAAGLITGRTSPAVELRAKEVGVGFVIQGAADKLAALRRPLGP